MADSDKTYIGIAACGCVTFAMVAGVESERSERKQLRDVIKSGRRIEVTTAGDARERMVWDCAHSTHVDDPDAEVTRLMEASV